MKLQMTMHHPSARIVSDKSHDRISTVGDHDSVLDRRIHQISPQSSIFVHFHHVAKEQALADLVDSQNRESVSMQMLFR